MGQLTTSLDAQGMTDVLAWAEATQAGGTHGGSANLGPFFANYQAKDSFSGGTVTLTPPNVVHISDCTLHYSIGISFGVDLNTIIPPLCTPTVCFHIPFDGEVCIPGVCITWPVITVNVPTYTDSLVFSADFTLSPQRVTTPNGPEWHLDMVIVGIPKLDLSLTAAALLGVIGAAVTEAVALVPFIGPVLAVAVAGIMGLITLAAVFGFLGPIMTPFVSGLTFTVFRHSPVVQLQQGLNATIQTLSAAVDAADNMVATARFAV